MPALLRIEDMRVQIQTPEGVVRAVDGVTLDIAAGETVALLGESGSGKSITALALLHLVPQPAGRIVSGRVLLNGQDLLRLPEREIRRIRGRRVAMIFQEPQTSLNPVLTVGQQIGEVLPKSLSRRARRERVIYWLDSVGIADPGRRCDEYPHQLSGGMKQRAMIAMAIAAEPEILVADEPTTALDVTIQAQVLDLLKELQQRTGMAMLFITHDLGVVHRVADRVAVMYAGHIVESAERDAFFSAPRHPYTRKLFRSVPSRNKRGGVLEVIAGSVPSLTAEFAGCRFVDRCEQAWDLCRSTVPVWREEAGHGVRCHLFDAAAGSLLAPAKVATVAVADADLRTQGASRALLQVNGLAVHFPVHRGVMRRVVGQVRAVDGVSLAIGVGRTLALVGESGCGKTTVGKAILQLIAPTAGEILFDGVRLDRLTSAALRPLRRHLQVIFQDPFASLDPRMLVGAILDEGMRALGIAADPEVRRRRASELLQHVGLGADILNRFPHEFSGGQRQRLCIARALSVQPRLIVCDEPTSALDVSVQAQILNLLKRLQQEFELSYLFITHNLAVVEYLAHEVAVMYLGRIVETGLAQEVLENPKHPYTRALLAAVPVFQGKREGTMEALVRPVGRPQGDIPSPLNPPAGCHYHPRCPQAMACCRHEYPDATQISTTHAVRCHLYPES
ncbi:MAG: ABC transporter ATP-binding protein [Acidiferrobacterales bacterium]